MNIAEAVAYGKKAAGFTIAPSNSQTIQHAMYDVRKHSDTLMQNHINPRKNI